MDFNTEQIEKAKNCKTLEEFKQLAKAEGYEFSDEEAAVIFNMTHTKEMSDEDLSLVSGSGKGEKGRWVLIDGRSLSPKCPFCGATINFIFKLYENDVTHKRKIDMGPLQCGCGAKITFDCFTSIFIFHKNGEARRVD